MRRIQISLGCFNYKIRGFLVNLSGLVHKTLFSERSVDSPAYGEWQKWERIQFGKNILLKKKKNWKKCGNIIGLYRLSKFYNQKVGKSLF